MIDTVIPSLKIHIDEESGGKSTKKLYRKRRVAKAKED